MQYDDQLFLIELGTRVKQLRKDRKLSHRRMVTDFGFHLGQLAKIENGGALSTQTMLKLCAAFDMRLEELVRDLGKANRRVRPVFLVNRMVASVLFCRNL